MANLMKANLISQKGPGPRAKEFPSYGAADNPNVLVVVPTNSGVLRRFFFPPRLASPKSKTTPALTGDLSHSLF